MALTLPVLIDRFVATKKVEGRTPKTCSWYRQMLSQFSDFAGPDKTLNQVTIDDARAFVAFLQEQDSRYQDHPYRNEVEGGLSSATINAHVRSLKVLSSWLRQEGYTGTDLFGRLKRPKIPKTIIQVLSEEEIIRLCGALNKHSFVGARMITVLALLLDTGLRARELCELTTANVHLDQRRLKVMGKGQKERFVPFGVKTQKVMHFWKLIWRDPLAEVIDAFFLNTDGSPITYSALTQAVKRLGKRVNIPRLHIHLLRHTFAVRYLTNGGDLISLRDILGHTSISVTQIYLNMTPAYLQVQYERYSPMDRIGVRL